MNKEELQKQATELLEFFEDKNNGYRPDHGHTMFEVNVKMHSQYVDIKELIETYPRRYQKTLIEEFTDERYNKLFNQWIEYEAECFIDDIKYQQFNPEDQKHFNVIAVTKGHKWKQFEGRGWLDPKTKDGKNTIKAILAMPDIKPEDQKKFQDALEGVKTGYGDSKTAVYGSFSQYRAYTETTAGFYGRSGGHFCYDLAEDPTDNLQSIVDWYWDDEKEAIEESTAIIKDAEDIRISVLHIETWIKNIIKKMSFEDELKHRIEEKIEEVKADQKDRRKEARDLKQKAAASKFSKVTVAECLDHKKETIRRNAQSIIKEL